mgnify:CR=1 FL=1
MHARVLVTKLRKLLEQLILLDVLRSNERLERLDRGVKIGAANIDR